MPFDDLVPRFYPSGHWQPAFEQQQQTTKKEEKKNNPQGKNICLRLFFLSHCLRHGHRVLQ